MMEFTGRKAELKEEFIKNRGYWADFWDYLLALDPEFFQTYLEYSSIPWLHGVLSPKMKEFIYITIDISTTHLYELGTRIHYQNAIKHGATPTEIMEVIKVASGLGIHTMTLGVPEIMKALKRAGREKEINRTLDKRQQSLKDEFIEIRGFWSQVWEDMLCLNPEFFASYLKLSANPHKSGVLDEKTIALLHIAANSSVTHLYQPTLEVQLDQALKHGATTEEIMEVMQLASVLGLHSCTFGVPLLAEELEKLGRPVGPDS